MTLRRDTHASDDLMAIADLIATAPDRIPGDDLIALLNSRGPIVQAGRVRLKAIMEAASKSIAKNPVTTESNPGPLINGVTERSFQEALMFALAGFNALANRLP